MRRDHWTADRLSGLGEAGRERAYDGFEDYTVMVRASTKVIARLNNKVYGDVAIAIARSPAHNEALRFELATLRVIAADHLAPRVIPLYSREPVYVRPPNTGGAERSCAAYLMKWIAGPHSKSAKAAFDTKLASLAAGQRATALADLAALDRYLKERHTVPDLQVMLDPMLGNVLLLDPGRQGLSGPRPQTHPFIAKWIALAEGTKAPIRVSDPSYEKFD